jgi:hypothetical protein
VWIILGVAAVINKRTTDTGIGSLSSVPNVCRKTDVPSSCATYLTD